MSRMTTDRMHGFHPGRVQRNTALAAAPSSNSSSMSGQFLPFPDLSRQLAETQVGLLSNVSNALGNFNFNLPGGGAGGGGASDFQGYFQNVGGPGTNFTDVPVNGVWTPDMLNRAVNSLWADNDARAGSQQQQLSENLRPGFGAGSPLLAELQANNAGRFQAIGARGENDLRQRAAIENAQHGLAQRGLQLNVEAQRAGNDLGRRQLGLAARRDDFTREAALRNSHVALLNALMRGAGSGSGALGPLAYSESQSSSGPAAFSDRFDPQRLRMRG